LEAIEMANTDNAKGLVPVNSIGGTYSGKLQRVVFLAATGTAAYVGGLVKPAGSSDADGVMDVTANVSTGDAVLGVIVAIEPDTNSSLTYRAASTLRYAYVLTDPNQIYEIQADGTDAITDVGSAADLTGFTGGSTVYGTSTMELSSASMTASGDGTEDVIVLGAVQRPDNEVGTNTKWLVRLNNHYLVDASAGA
jgi:multidrug efflux pump subunit AcrA (membrane-fusion protein)